MRRNNSVGKLNVPSRTSQPKYLRDKGPFINYIVKRDRQTVKKPRQKATSSKVRDRLLKNRDF